MAHLERLLGGSPIAVLAKLLFLCIVIGAIMTGLGLDAGSILRRLAASVRAVFALGFDAFRDVGRYLLTGAVVVIPIFVLSRVFRGK